MAMQGLDQSPQRPRIRNLPRNKPNIRNVNFIIALYQSLFLSMARHIPHEHRVSIGLLGTCW
jgi:hypothetical protein